MSDQHDHLHGLPDEAALRALASRLDASGRAFAAERSGLADRVLAASAPVASASAVTSSSLPFPSSRRWGLAAAAAVALVGSVAVYLVGQRSTVDRSAAGVLAVRAPELAPIGGSEALLIALIDEDTALHAADGSGLDAGAVVLMSGGSVDDVTVELEELLAAGGRR